MSVQDKLKLISEDEWRRFPEHPYYWFSMDGKAAKHNAKPSGDKVFQIIGCTCGIGYRAVTMQMGGGLSTRKYIHRAVCELFNGPSPDGKPFVRHLDCEMTNNAAWNLAWGDCSENAQDGVRNGKSAKGVKNPQAKLNDDSVKLIRDERASNKTPYYKLGEMFGVSTMTAFRAAKGIAWK